MTATLAIHRGHMSAERVVRVNGDERGALTDHITRFVVPAGPLTVDTKLGDCLGLASEFTVAEGDVLDLVCLELPRPSCR